ncbi:HD-GYP domain-containing protein [Rahnella variigena]|uniref:HD-GYP domain-containing protein n=1 Tax=Rahnella variigena TaxID=574964 RepID=UPI00244695A3|nr:HD domain-containing phosphohydrolase [Rahnella variigena]MDH2896047.1 HD domain-containing protein [Rahnella variigena]
MDITFTDFLIGFSSALDLLSPENGHRGVRRAYIVMNIARQRRFSPLVQKRLFIAALLRDISHGAHTPQDCVRRIANIPLLAGSAGLIAARGQRHPESRLLDLADNLDLLALHEYPRGHYPSHAIETLCDSIGSRYQLDDILALRELGLEKEFWAELASATLINTAASFSPFAGTVLTDDELTALSSLLAAVIDQHCLSAAQHSVVVADIAGRLAQMYGFSKKGVLRIRVAGLLHDLGKLVVPAVLLTKTSALTDSERRQIHIHPQFTWKILSRISGMHDIARMASFHHERPDGKGYPFHLRGVQLDLGPRIISVADCYAALREARSYKTACSPEKCFSIMQQTAERGGLDAEVVGALHADVKAAGETMLSASPLLL